MATEKTSAVVKYLDQSGNEGTKSITDINPNATDSQIVELTQAVMSVTTNDYKSTSRITKKELTDNKTAATLVTGAGPTSKTTEITVARDNLVITNDACFANLFSDSDGKPFVVSNSAAVAVDFLKIKNGENFNWIAFMFTLGSVDEWCPNTGDFIINRNGDKIAENGGTGAGDIVIALAETDTYTQSNTVTIHVTA